MKTYGCLNCTQGNHSHHRNQGQPVCECKQWCCAACLTAGSVQPGHSVCQLPPIIDRNYLERHSERLGSLPWRWIRASTLFDSPAEMASFVCLSKDAPTLTLACEMLHGFEPFDADANKIGEFGLLHDRYIPFGFAIDVAQWRHLYGDAIPVAVTESYRDETRPEAEGGSPEAFTSHFSDGYWWVVYPPENA